MQTCCEENKASYIVRIVKLILTIIILGTLLWVGYNGSNSTNNHCALSNAPNYAL